MENKRKIILPLVISLLITSTGCEQKDKKQPQNVKININVEDIWNEKQDITKQISSVLEYLDIYNKSCVKNEYFEMEEIITKYPLLSQYIGTKEDFYNKYLYDALKIYDIISKYQVSKYQTRDNYICKIIDEINYMSLYKQYYGEYDDEALKKIEILVKSLPEYTENPFTYYQQICDTIYEIGQPKDIIKERKKEYEF